MQVCLYISHTEFWYFLEKKGLFLCKLFLSFNSSFSVRWALTKRQSMVSYPSTPHKYLSLFMCTITIKVKSAGKHSLMEIPPNQQVYIYLFFTTVTKSV